ncbi:hypothetical protein [Streptomyces sp. NPDC056291]|uniref:hypothetical protein n=1 Tax=Streptomyces sp. NPDC056291 TaxID=3345772 RepID=UPI0035D6E139
MPPDPAGGQPVRGADELGEVEAFAGDVAELAGEVGAGPPVRPRAHGFDGGLADAVLLAEGQRGVGVAVQRSNGQDVVLEERASTERQAPPRRGIARRDPGSV